ncbi:hypothetical protein D5S18_00970 [Nocardia panacis]|uniref:Uncharacterized protein n=1 Tax=Nocardia panacis TaxID=2340916 RepID=A0A3A4KU08_9NOCA|nr:hypothetical protein D5S18_00970 [Nocardia panacis]
MGDDRARCARFDPRAGNPGRRRYHGGQHVVQRGDLIGAPRYFAQDRGDRIAGEVGIDPQIRRILAHRGGIERTERYEVGGRPHGPQQFGAPPQRHGLAPQHISGRQRHNQDRDPGQPSGDRGEQVILPDPDLQ